MRATLILAASAAALVPVAASAGETTRYAYDAKGRLTAADTRRPGQGGMLSTYVHDNADNRARSSTSGNFIVGMLSANQGISIGQGVTSPDGRFLFAFLTDGNLVLYDQSHSVLWTSGTAGAGGSVVWMQGDGNLVMYNAATQPIWATNTGGYSNAFFAVQSDGNLVVYTSSNAAVWSSGTCCY